MSNTAKNITAIVGATYCGGSTIAPSYQTVKAIVAFDELSAHQQSCVKALYGRGLKNGPDQWVVTNRFGALRLDTFEATYHVDLPAMKKERTGQR